jgi:hypothetical protein
MNVPDHNRMKQVWCWALAAHLSLQEAAAAAAARDASRRPGLLHWPTNMLLDLLDFIVPARFAAQLQPVKLALQHPDFYRVWILLLMALVLNLASRWVARREVSVARLLYIIAMRCSTLL